jgi:hypothetical protein
MLMLDVLAETRLLIHAKQPGNATDDSASGAADNRANRASGMIAFMRAFGGAADDALGARGKRQGKKHNRSRGEDFHVHVEAPNHDFSRACHRFEVKRMELIGEY